MKNSRIGISKWLFILSCLFFASSGSAATLYTWSDGTTVVVTVNANNKWYIQLINPDNTGSESGVLKQKGAYDQAAQMVTNWGSPSVWNNDGGYSNILSVGAYNMRPGYLFVGDGFYYDGIGRFDESVAAPASPPPYTSWVKGVVIWLFYFPNYPSW